MERTGAYIDHKVNDAQRGIADFSQRAGQSLDQAGKSVGAGAEQVGTKVHDKLTPSTDAPPLWIALRTVVSARLLAAELCPSQSSRCPSSRRSLGLDNS
jgi:hypothetical protein